MLPLVTFREPPQSGSSRKHQVAMKGFVIECVYLFSMVPVHHLVPTGQYFCGNKKKNLRAVACPVYAACTLNQLCIIEVKVSIAHEVGMRKQIIPQWAQLCYRHIIRNYLPYPPKCGPASFATCRK